MTLISRVGIALTFLAIALPFAVSSAVVSSKECSQDEFWYEASACCLRNGGPLTPPSSPPKDTECPSSHYWGDKQGCCVPYHPPPAHGPPPQCPKNWDWISTLRKCVQTHTPTTPPPSAPSGHLGQGAGEDGQDNHRNSDGQEGDSQSNASGHNYKRYVHRKTRPTHLCPAGLDACPIVGAWRGDYECLDTTTELESCGGCVSLGRGQDCTAIPGAWNVGCEQGHCAVYTCAGGFELAPHGTSCIPLK
ncbi:hypothetical protein L208DRAFT_1245223 [Tricholoma matsutake]|nr:hypothetical protein L208DRAFT_1245223 [Tricholoma matsutake 945]